MIRKARMGDVKAIQKLIAEYARKGDMLPRSLSEIYENLRDYFVFLRNGEIVETGASGAVLGNPATAVAWLANKVHEFGVRLEPGHVILPGSCTRAVDVAAGDVITAEFAGLGSVTVSFV